MIYLACPYDHPDRAIRVQRYDKVTRVAARYMEEGKHVFSPITHCHPLAEIATLPKDWTFWADYDYQIMKACHSLHVLRLPGWQASKGVQAEIRLAQQLGHPVEYIDPM